MQKKGQKFDIHEEMIKALNRIFTKSPIAKNDMKIRFIRYGELSREIKNSP